MIVTRTLLSFSLLLPAFASAQAPQTARPRAPQKQRAAATDRTDAILLTNGWALLSQGLVDDAYRKAEEIVARDPRSSAGLSLLLEVELARGGVPQALQSYERWLGSRGLEEPGALRRLAVALLTEAGRQRRDHFIRQQAILALAQGGEPTAGFDAGESGLPADLATAAEIGDRRATAQLSAELARQSPDKVSILEALGKSRQLSAAAAIAAQLTDPREEVRAAAVDALANLRAEAYRTQLTQALRDSSSYVRTRAARALFQMGDMAGLPLLQQLAASDSAESRLIAAEAMATSPDRDWQALVRSLLGAPEPEVRAGAARLIAPHDPALAKSVLDALMQDSNIAIRELAGRSLAEALNADDLPSLKRLMKSSDALTRIRAAGAILKATL
jgi:HEAT repeat protein